MARDKSKSKILCIDDEPNIVRSLQWLLWTQDDTLDR